MKRNDYHAAMLLEKLVEKQVMAYSFI